MPVIYAPIRIVETAGDPAVNFAAPGNGTSTSNQFYTEVIKSCAIQPHMGRTYDISGWADPGATQPVVFTGMHYEAGGMVNATFMDNPQ